ncbi:hypothetical protein CSUB01_12010 [Colletotrichum sublineola]|uniref:Uncharacterized protein n=1 Tax=Colletotrichum sublineola TaxID=1173701 RepID=A0A066Y1K3_COLSU|nr:hypothetical protein CSUB01_12010 [Colletotrichum sublineola]
MRHRDGRGPRKGHKWGPMVPTPAHRQPHRRRRDGCVPRRRRKAPYCLQEEGQSHLHHYKTH